MSCYPIGWFINRGTLNRSSFFATGAMMIVSGCPVGVFHVRLATGCPCLVDGCKSPILWHIVCFIYVDLMLLMITSHVHFDFSLHSFFPSCFFFCLAGFPTILLTNPDAKYLLETPAHLVGDIDGTDPTKSKSMSLSLVNRWKNTSWLLVLLLQWCCPNIK